MPGGRRGHRVERRPGPGGRAVPAPRRGAPDGTARVRIAATVTDADTVEVALHAEESGFVAEHFRARLVYSGPPVPEGPPTPCGPGLGDVPLDPAADLYGDVLFQGDRFRRLRRFHRVSARHVDADLSVDEVPDWFAAYLPGGLLLADPGMRDALMHGNQVCVPDATLLPSGIDRVYPLAAGADVPKELRYVAVERDREGSTYVYDIAAHAPDGRVVERWEGLRLTAVRKRTRSGPWAAPLLASHLERTVEELTGRRVALAVEPDEGHGPGEAPHGRRCAAFADGAGREPCSGRSRRCHLPAGRAARAL